MSGQMAEERAFLYYLHAAPGIGRVRALRLLKALGSAEQIWRRPERAAALLEERLREPFLAYSRSASPAEDYARILSRGIRFTALPLSDYPAKLRAIPDPPFGITWLGRLPDEQVPAVSVIGARQCSAYGRAMAERLGAELAAAGVQVVSGMAVGIDGLSQSAAIAVGGASFAILGSGVDVCYPSENRALYEALQTSGGVISESPPGTAPRANLFPQRNRLISAFCDALVVVEARRRSGTFITVDMALEQGKDIFALPGRATDALSDGCHQLIRQGAGLATCAADIVGGLYRAALTEAHTSSAPKNDGAEAGGRDVGEEKAAQETGGATLSHAERLLLGHLDVRPKSAAELAQALADAGEEVSFPEVAETLVGLCVRRLVVQEGGCFRLRDVR